MPYLISDISDDTELLPVNAALSNPTYPLFYDLASETIKVLAGANTTEWQVARGVGNTQAVRHSRGTPLILNASPYGGGGGGVTSTDGTTTVDPTTSIQVPSGTLTDLGGGVAGLTIPHMIGPFTIHFNDAGIETDGVLLTALPSGTVVLSTAAFVVTGFNNTRELVICLGGPDYGPPDDDYGAVAVGVGVGSTSAGNGYSLSRPLYDGVMLIGATSTAVWNNSGWGRLTAAGALVAFVVTTGSSPTQGEVDIYALIAVP